MHRLIAIAAAAFMSSAIPLSASPKADQPAHPEWHVTRQADSFENHVSVSASAESGGNSLVVTCGVEDGLTMMLSLKGIPARHASAEPIVILKGGNAAPMWFTGDQLGRDLIFVHHAERATLALSDNRDIGVRVKLPNGEKHDARFHFSAMDAATRNVLVSTCPLRSAALR